MKISETKESDTSLPELQRYSLFQMGTTGGFIQRREMQKKLVLISLLFYIISELNY